MNNNHIKISKAVFGDEESIAHIAQSVQIDLDQEAENSCRGFLVWGQPSEIYRHRLEISRYFVAARSPTSVVGFLMAYNFSAIQTLQQEMTYEDNLLRFAIDQAGEEVLFVDQIVVAQAYQRRGIASQLYEFLKHSNTPSHHMAAILHQPVRNLASIQFFTELGWQPIAEVQQDIWLWGMYERKLTKEIQI